MIILLYVIFVIYLYNTTITFFSWKKPKTKKDLLNLNDKQTFSILIPCHNEEEVIEDTLNAIYNNDYNKMLYTTYIVLDNCTDSTLDKCNNFIKSHLEFNCETIIVNGGSKPKALNAATNYLKINNKWTSDNIIVIDADNKISKTLLKTYNYYHENNYKILQCKIASLNSSSFIAKGFVSSFNTMNEGFQYARNRVGLSASLSGTGFSINRLVWDDVDFNKCDSLTEDLEFSILSIIKGYKIKFIPEDYILNQHLDSFKPSLIQRVRWCRGHMQVSIKLNKRLLLNFIKKPSFQLFDSFLFVNNPSKSVMYTIANICTLFYAKQNHYILMTLIILFLIYNLIFILHCNQYRIKYILPHLFFSLCMHFIIVIGAVTWKNNVWKKTEHRKII